MQVIKIVVKMKITFLVTGYKCVYIDYITTFHGTVTRLLTATATYKL